MGLVVFWCVPSLFYLSLEFSVVTLLHFWYPAEFFGYQFTALIYPTETSWSAHSSIRTENSHLPADLVVDIEVSPFSDQLPLSIVYVFSKDVVGEFLRQVLEKPLPLSHAVFSTFVPRRFLNGCFFVGPMICTIEWLSPYVRLPLCGILRVWHTRRLL